MDISIILKLLYLKFNYVIMMNGIVSKILSLSILIKKSIYVWESQNIFNF